MWGFRELKCAMGKKKAFIQVYKVFNGVENVEPDKEGEIKEYLDKGCFCGSCRVLLGGMWTVKPMCYHYIKIQRYLNHVAGIDWRILRYVSLGSPRSGVGSLLHQSQLDCAGSLSKRNLKGTTVSVLKETCKHGILLLSAQPAPHTNWELSAMKQKLQGWALCSKVLPLLLVNLVEV